MAESWERLRTSAGALALANLVPLVGVVVLGWDLHSLLVVYWLESAVVGALTVPKMVRATDFDDPKNPGTIAGLADLAGVDDDAVRLVGLFTLAGRVCFFCVHYGLFWVVHGVFVLWFPSFFPDLASASPTVVAAGGLGLLASHVVSYRRNYVGGREYERTTASDLMSAPYRRVVVLHVTVLVGAVGVASLGTPVAAIAVMVLAKTVLDLRGHWREHTRTPGRLPV